MPSEAVLAGIAVATIVALALIAMAGLQRPARGRTILAEFGLAPNGYRVLGADVGGLTKQFHVKANGTQGTPDAVFESLTEPLIVAGEVKSRSFRGKISPYERYQVTLYLGALATKYPGRRVEGRIRYSNRVVSLQFDPECYRRLIALLPQFRRATRRFS